MFCQCAHYRRNGDEELRKLERQVEAENDPVAREKFFVQLFRSGQMPAYIDRQLQLGAVGPAALWYWRNRFQAGCDVSFPITNDSSISVGHPCHGRMFNVLLQHPGHKPPLKPKHTSVAAKLQNEPLVKFYEVAAHKPSAVEGARSFEETGDWVTGTFWPQARADVPPDPWPIVTWLGRITPGQYYAETLLTGRRSFLDQYMPETLVDQNSRNIKLATQIVGLNLHSVEAAWNIDGPTYAKVLTVLHYVLDGWVPNEREGMNATRCQSRSPAEIWNPPGRRRCILEIGHQSPHEYQHFQWD